VFPTKGGKVGEVVEALTGCAIPSLLNDVKTRRDSCTCMVRFPGNSHSQPKQYPATPPICYSVMWMGMLDKKGLTFFYFPNRRKDIRE